MQKLTRLLTVVVTIALSCALVNGECKASAPPIDRDITILGITLGKDTLSGVQERLGDAPALSYGEGGNSLTEICYRGADGTSIIFASGVLGGPRNVLTHFTISRNVPIEFHGHNCLLNLHINRSIHTGGGLSLVLSKTQLISLLGVPIQAGHILKFHFVWHKSLQHVHHQREGYDVATSVVAWTQGETITKLRITHTSST